MTIDPYRLAAPALISFSGGRTSGYMLRRILAACGGRLPEGVHAVFTNTGRERTETLDFVRECATRWDVPIRWIEYVPTDDGPMLGRLSDDERVRRASLRFREVTYATASRDGAPFDALIAKRLAGSALPGTMNRYCSEILKTRTKRNFAWSLGWREWADAVGIRADEPRRVAKLRAANADEPWTVEMPLAAEGVAVEDVMAFWSRQPFDLRLQPHEGNCDLCFLKASWKLERLMRDRPDLAEWWIGHEERSGKRFRIDRPAYADFLYVAQRQESFGFCDVDRGDCVCTE